MRHLSVEVETPQPQVALHGGHNGTGFPTQRESTCPLCPEVHQRASQNLGADSGLAIFVWQGGFMRTWAA